MPPTPVFLSRALRCTSSVPARHSPHVRVFVLSACVYILKCCGGVVCTRVRVLGRRAAMRWWGSCRGRVLARRQSCFTKFVTCARLLQPLFHVCASGSILCGRVGHGRELERAAHGTTLSFGYLCPCFSLYLLVSLSLGSCDPGPPPPVSISTAQQRVYVCIFVVVEQGVCGHRGACCAVTT